jgi:hypothetical protein
MTGTSVFLTNALTSRADAAEVPGSVFLGKCPTASMGVAILIRDPDLLVGIKESLNRFESDLCADGYAVKRMTSTGKLQSPKRVRRKLRRLYRKTEGRLAGAILIGDVPHAYQQVVLRFSDGSELVEEVISMQYYADLDGKFSMSPDYVSAGGHDFSFDQHRGQIDSEIWVGVLPMYGSDSEKTIAALNRYFAKNHQYRVGQYTLPRAFAQISEHLKAKNREEYELFRSALRNGPYSWQPFSNSEEALFYFDSSSPRRRAFKGYRKMTRGVADFTVGSAHGWWKAHGQISASWVERHDVRTAFFWSNGCAVGNIDQPGNFLTELLYSPRSLVVIARGTTNNSGGMGSNEDGFFGRNIATALSEGKSFGDAILSHVNVPLVWPWSESREFHIATSIVLGDPTLRRH